MADSDTELIKRAQAEDLDAFCLLAERYARGEITGEEYRERLEQLR